MPKASNNDKTLFTANWT